MADDARITIRMGTEDVQAIDDYLADHPEFDDNRSLFIKNMLREYFNRDAEVNAGKNVPQNVVERDVCIDIEGTKKSEIILTLTRRYADVIRDVVDSEEFLTDGDFIRDLLKTTFMTNEAFANKLKENFEKADRKVYMQ